MLTFSLSGLSVACPRTSRKRAISMSYMRNAYRLSSLSARTSVQAQKKLNEINACMLVQLVRLLRRGCMCMQATRPTIGPTENWGREHNKRVPQ
jgi:hypothetical protein